MLGQTVPAASSDEEKPALEKRIKTTEATQRDYASKTGQGVGKEKEDGGRRVKELGAMSSNTAARQHTHSFQL